MLGVPGLQNQHTLDVSLKADGFVMADGYWAVSDARTKSTIGVSDSKDDLNTLRNIKVTDFTYLDFLRKGTGEHKKVIAQELEEVYPQAVTQSPDAVPDIYRPAEAVEFKSERQELIVELADHGLEVGETVRLLLKAGERDVKIVEVPHDDQFIVGDWSECTDWAFVYGREVDDFMKVDYEAVSMLNVSATQELAKKVDANIGELETLKIENENLKSRLAKMEKLLEKIDLSQIQPKPVVKSKARPWYHAFMWWL